MRAPHPVGARVVLLDQRLARISVGAHEWREALDVSAPPTGALATDARAATQTVTLPHAAHRPWAPAHVRARRAADDDILITWIRCARSGGDAWGAAEPPLGASVEAYQIEIWDGPVLRRTESASAPSFLYAAADQTADFGGLAASFQVRIAQIGEDGALGVKKELTIAA